MFVQFAVNVMGVEGSFREPETLILDAINKLSEFFTKIGLPQTLSELGFEESDFEVMAKRSTRIAYGIEGPIGGIQKLSWQDVVEIFKLAK